MKLALLVCLTFAVLFSMASADRKSRLSSFLRYFCQSMILFENHLHRIKIWTMQVMDDTTTAAAAFHMHVATFVVATAACVLQTFQNTCTSIQTQEGATFFLQPSFPIKSIYGHLQHLLIPIKLQISHFLQLMFHTE